MVDIRIVHFSFFCLPLLNTEQPTLRNHGYLFLRRRYDLMELVFVINPFRLGKLVVLSNVIHLQTQINYLPDKSHVIIIIINTQGQIVHINFFKERLFDMKSCCGLQIPEPALCRLVREKERFREGSLSWLSLDPIDRSPFGHLMKFTQSSFLRYVLGLSTAFTD